MKGKTGIRRIINALYYSADGIKAACEESGFRQLLLLNAVSLPLLYFLDFELAVKMLLLTVSVGTLIVELFNTGIEAAVDHTSLEKSDLAKRAKDVGSAAQYLTLLLLFVLWLIALWHRYL
ncbi:MAG: diacylglycerol kinase [Neisseria sp.]|nr:diacylglycerol kinase [Neisseria sp.]